jgi:glutamate dehydrogenase (NADP+)
MFGQYKRLAHEFTGVLTGKAMKFGGSLIRTEATGYGNAIFMEEMLKHHGDSIEGKICCVSGSGNVATYCVEKITQLGGKVVTLSDSSGFIHDCDGIDAKKLAYVINLKSIKRGRISEYAEQYGCDFHAGKRPWSVPCDLAFPCATQNELDENDARTLVANGCKAVSEGANMPTTVGGIKVLLGNKLLYGPGKAANAGGVAVSGLEMTQNSIRMDWTVEELDKKLHDIMVNIHAKCAQHGYSDGYTNYIKGVNIAGFIKVADAMLAYGVI